MASIQRALAFWVASQVSGLHVFADELDNRQFGYPCCVLREISGNARPFGCGTKEFQERDSHGVVTANGKMHHMTDVFRCTIWAPSTTSKGGQEIVETTLDAIEQAALKTIISGRVTLTDTGVSPSATFYVDRIRPTGRANVPPDKTGEPFRFGGALSLALSRSLALTVSAEPAIKTIHLQMEE